MSMKRPLTFLTLCICVAAPSSASDLLAVYQRALQNDPQLREAEAIRLAALEAKPQALSALLPQLSGSGTISRERDTGSTNTTESVTNVGGPPSFITFPFEGRTTTTTH